MGNFPSMDMNQTNRASINHRALGEPSSSLSSTDPGESNHLQACTTAPEARIFRSAWLCSEPLSQALRPVMKEIVDTCNADMREPVKFTDFLPHVTLFCGDHLSEPECYQIIALAQSFFTRGFNLTPCEIECDLRFNPPLYLRFEPTDPEERALFEDFQAHVKSQLDLDIHMNPQFLHASLLYRTNPFPLPKKIVDIAKEKTQPLIGQSLPFQSFAITTGKAWEAESVAQWRHVRPMPLPDRSRDSGCLSDQERTELLSGFEDTVDASVEPNSLDKYET